MKILNVLLTALFTFGLTNATWAQEKTPQFIGLWKGKNGCRVEASIYPLKNIKYTYGVKIALYKNEKDWQAKKVQKDIYVTSRPADSAEEVEATVLGDYSKNECAEKGYCEVYWSDKWTRIATLGFNSDLVLTRAGIWVDTGMISWTRWCKDLIREQE